MKHVHLAPLRDVVSHTCLSVTRPYFCALKVVYFFNHRFHYSRKSKLSATLSTCTPLPKPPAAAAVTCVTVLRLLSVSLPPPPPRRFHINTALI